MAKKLYGTDPDQVPTNADLGTMAYQDAENPRLNNVVISGQPNDVTDGTLLRVKRGPSESGTWATVAIEAQTANGNSRIAFVNDIEPSAADAHGMIDFEHQTNRMQFFVDGSEAAHFNSSGNLAFPNGQGIDFSASAGSGQTSSLLDDYEEGTWTPVLKGSSGATKTWSYSAQSGYYTKVGNQVTVYFNIQLSSNGSGTDGNAYIDGLPFTSSNLTNLTNFYGFFWKQLVETGDVALQGRNQVNTSTIALQDGSSNYPDISPINTSVFTNDRRIRGTLTYTA